MESVNIHEAKTHLSRLIEEVASGKEVVIARAGKPVARLVPYLSPPERRPGSMKDRLVVPDDFDDPLPGELLDLFEGKVQAP